MLRKEAGKPKAVHTHPFRYSIQCPAKRLRSRIASKHMLPPIWFLYLLCCIP